MKWYAVIVAALATTVVAKDNLGLPDCAAPCVKLAVSKATKCSFEDAKCVCDPANAQKIKQAGSKCVLDKCGAKKAMSKLLHPPSPHPYTDTDD